MGRVTHSLIVVCLLTFAIGGVARAGQDAVVDPAKDNPSVPRFPGMQMDSGKATDFDAFEFPIDADGGIHRAEGKSWDFTYVLKDGARHASPLEIVRNYAAQFAARGGKIVYQTRDATDATMMMPLGKGERWLHLYINNDGEQVLMNIIETAAMIQKLEFSADEMSTQVASTGKVTLHGILFDTALTEIKPESAPVLDEVAGMMKANAAMQFRIDGHTDNVGNKAANLTLSRGRAASVKTALVSRGIDAGRLTTDGLGDTQPVGDNSTDAGREQNRRVELVKR